VGGPPDFAFRGVGQRRVERRRRGALERLERAPGTGLELRLTARGASVNLKGRERLEGPVSYRLLSLGVNVTPFAKTALRFAELDAQRVVRAFTSSRGPVSEDEAVLLRGPEARLAAVRDALDMLIIFPPDHFLFAWTGHGGENGIALADGILTYDELAYRLGAIDARVKVAIFSTCHAGAARRQFETRVAGVGDLARAWRNVLLAASPGLRLFTAVGPDELAHEDAGVRGSRFVYGLMTALRFAPGDVAMDGHHWISDLSVLPRARAIIARRWPREALPSLVGPSAHGEPFPLLLSQAERPRGFATVMLEPLVGVALRASVTTLERRFVDTCVEATAASDDGTVFLSTRAPCLPPIAVARAALDFTVDPGLLLRHSWTSTRLRAGLPVRLHWLVRVLDDHGHVLDQARYTNSYRWTPARAA
jgi:hypothetical protein